ncbi:hypothetical protein [Patulibacter sp.]|uniref:hypothetical protein n=1 Tax=Patulibacter sp. TaxID=1912859 RepID=UPI002725F704|nr:hypothetical protein [Patulibacter sp.]MDO9407489.1 hypothetical protein [Patulibacter sp.]
MSYRRFVAVPQLEFIVGSDDTSRAELIAPPLVRTTMGDHVIEDVAVATAIAQAESPAAGPQAAA